MNLNTKMKIHKFKKQVGGVIRDTYYFLVTPLAWCEEKFYKFKSKRVKNKVDNLSHEKVADLMANHIQNKLIERQKYVFKFYVCKSDYSKYVDYLDSPITVVDYIIDSFDYTKKRKYKLLRKWGEDIHYIFRLNDVWLNGVLTQMIHDRLCEVDGLDVHWEYETELADPTKTWRPIRDYQKHLVIKVKE